MTRTWETEDPDFTICFEKTALVWTPCVFLLCFAPLEVYYIAKSKSRDIPWNWLNISKLVSSDFGNENKMMVKLAAYFEHLQNSFHSFQVLTALLIALSVADMGNAAYRHGDGQQVYPVDFYTPFIKIGTFVSLFCYEE